MTGTTIGRYEVLDKLGEGGMGVVYRARDVLLNRTAAIKLLSADAPLDDERKHRFLQEAQAASALNHPNIVTVYDVCLSDPQDFIAMEYVHGSTLDALLGPSGLPLRDVLSYAVQIADALAAAHAAGITHRDIKPGNIMVTDAGNVKILDFGLAKLADPITRTPSDISRTIPMRQAPKTVEGTIVGTVAYMSPEQAEGKRVDHRADIFAFGAVLYEMLTGHRAFSGDSPISTLASILQVEPEDVSRHTTGIPRDLNRILRRCLEKSPERRWQNMTDVRMALEDVRQDLQSGVFTQPAAAPPAAVPLRNRSLLPLAAILLTGAAITGALLWRRAPAARTPDRYLIRGLTYDAGANVSPAISPDGKLIAYSSDRAGGAQADIWVQQVAGGEPVRLTNAVGLAHDPVFSPDGSRIAFRGGVDGNSIFLTSTLGGNPRKIGDGYWPHWSPDGNHLAYVSGEKIVIVPIAGGTPREIKTKGPVVGRALWLPGGKTFLFYSRRSGAPQNEWYTIGAEGGEESPAGAAAAFKSAGLDVTRAEGLVTDGVLVAVGRRDSANIYRVPFDFAGRRVTGPPVPITVAPGLSFWPSASADGRRIAFASAGRFNTNLWRMPIDHAKGVVSGEPRAITEGLEERLAPYPTRDGNYLVYKVGAEAPVDIRVRNLSTGEESSIAESATATPPVPSDDSTQVAWAVTEEKRLSVYIVPIRGGVPRRVCTSCGRPIQWFAGDTRLLLDNAGPEHYGIAVLDVATGQTRALLRHPTYRLFTPRVSPDGRLLCFTAITAPVQRRTYLVHFSPDREIDSKEWTVVSSGSNLERQPCWSPNGDIIYFLSERDAFRCIWGLRIDRATLKPVGDAFAVRHLHQFRHSLLDFNDVADIGFSIAGNTIYLAVREIQSNIWLAEKQSAGQAESKQP
jgi:Tol biopolymer transport system component/predicted Ser/Thr protein kinase